MSWPFNSPDSFDSGFWTGRPGSLDWCEENYVYCTYVAEMTNTVSNLSYIILALYGLRNCSSQQLPTRFLLCNICLLCVGLGSASYHATLRNWAQTFDELPMLYTVGFITYAVFDTTPHEQPYILPAMFIALACAWTSAYINIDNPAFHEFSFALLGIFTTFRVLFLLRSPPLLSHPALARRIRMLYYQGFATFVSGFVVWNLENWSCASLRVWRVDMGWPATWLAQGHAYWHVATAVGAYRMIVATELFYLVLTQHPVRYTVDGRWFPVVHQVQEKK